MPPVPVDVDMKISSQAGRTTLVCRMQSPFSAAVEFDQNQIADIQTQADGLAAGLAGVLGGEVRPGSR